MQKPRSKPILGYWNCRGRAQPIRLLLAHLGVDFVDKQYTSPEEWIKDKQNLGLDFPNLPYYIDGDLKLTQTHTILSYIARKYDLDAQTEPQRNAISLLQNQLTDYFTEIGLVMYKPNFAELKPNLIEKQIPAQIKLLTNFMERNNKCEKFVAGERLTYVDFMFYEHLVKMKVFVPEILEKFPNLVWYLERIEGLSGIREYMEKAGPLMFNAPYALWNADY